MTVMMPSKHALHRYYIGELIFKGVLNFLKRGQFFSTVREDAKYHEDPPKLPLEIFILLLLITPLVESPDWERD